MSNLFVEQIEKQKTEMQLKYNSIRNSNIELLRIISMLMVIACHYIGHGGFEWKSVPFSLQKILALFSGSGGRLGVAIFVLISGYFGCKSTFKLKHIIMLIIQTWIFSIIIFALFIFIIPTSNIIGFKAKVELLLPNIYGANWFITVYIMLYALSPYINNALSFLTQKQHLSLIRLLVFVWCIIPSFTVAKPAYSHLSFFITLYLIAAYFQFYPRKRNVKHHALLSIFWAFVILISILSIDYLSQYVPFLRGGAQYFTEFHMLPTFMLSIELFLTFLNMKPYYNKYVNGIAATVFGIYLIHDNRLVRHFIWIDFFKNSTYWGTSLFWLHFICVVIIVFISCAIISYFFWNKFVGKFLNLFLDKYLRHIVDYIATMGEKVAKLLFRFL